MPKESGNLGSSFSCNSHALLQSYIHKAAKPLTAKVKRATGEECTLVGHITLLEHFDPPKDSLQIQIFAQVGNDEPRNLKGYFCPEQERIHISI